MHRSVEPLKINDSCVIMCKREQNIAIKLMLYESYIKIHKRRYN